MIKSALQFWQNLKIDAKAQALEGDNIIDVVAKVVHLLRIEFLGEGYIDRDSPQYAKQYVHALLKLELNNMSFRQIYLYLSGLLLPYIWKDWNRYNVSKYVLLKNTRSMGVCTHQRISLCELRYFRKKDYIFKGKVK